MKKAVVVLGLFGVLYYFNAYVCDDAFITFRSVDNFARGLGLRWNPAERVQAFTSPLFALLFAGPYAIVRDTSAVPNPDRPYWLAIGLSFGLAAWALLHLQRSYDGGPAFWALFALLMSSQAFVTFTSSGLETPLIYLTLAAFFTRWLGKDPIDPRGYAWTFFFAGLVLLTRLDLMLLIVPALGQLIASGWRRLGRRLVLPLLAGVSPVVLWHLFSLCYYGFLLPNSYYAKLGVDAPQSLLWWMGRYYLSLNARQDPITLVVCAAAIAVSCTSRRMFLAGLGVTCYLTYVVSIGADFLGFRFLAPPFLVSAMILIHRLQHWIADTRRSVWIALTAAAVACSIVVPNSPLRAIREGPRAPDVDYYYPASGLARWTPGAHFPFATFLQVDSPADCQRRRVTAPTVAVGADGLNGFCRGPLASLIDPHGITDPLTARLSVPVTRRFRPAHVWKPIPIGYAASMGESANRIGDPDLAPFYGRLRTIVTGPLWTVERWRSIWQMNFTAAARTAGPTWRSTRFPTGCARTRSKRRSERLVAPSAADERHDLDLCARLDHRVRVTGAPDHDLIVLDGHQQGIDLQPFQQHRDRDGRLQIVGLAVQLDAHTPFTVL